MFDVTRGEQLFKLLADDGAANDLFGHRVGISGNVAIVGAPGDNDNGSDSGSAYLFDTTTGEQLCKLLRDDPAAEDQFGVSVAINEAIAIVGACGDDDNESFSGSAYLFDVSTGEQTFKLLPNDGAALDFFGEAVAISGATAIVGAYQDDDNGGESGSAYLFDINTGEQLFKLLPVDGSSSDRFGFSVAIDGGPREEVALVGAFGDRSAYLFDAAGGPGTCPWDLDDSGGVGTGDLILLLGSWGDPYGTADLIELLGNWGPCPK